MRLDIDNVGKISHANIEINGITVIAGENNTGKSTIGKILFCVFHAFYKIEEQIKTERVKSISRVLNSYFYENSKRHMRGLDSIELAYRLVEEKENFLADTRLIRKEIEEFLESTDDIFSWNDNQEGLEKLVDRIYLFLRLEESEVQKIILQKRLDAEFAMKVGHLNHADQRTAIKLKIKDNSIEFTVTGNEKIEIAHYMNLNKEIIYMDDPFVLDTMGGLNWGVLSNSYDHRHDLMWKAGNNKKVEDFSVIDELVVRKKLERILEKMQGVCEGDITSDERNAFVYKTEKLNGDLTMMNLSTGLKSFAILRKLLQNGNIDENGVIILDEPEIHLHPEWQLKFAEIIVLIQKEFNAHILLNTHSPYFLNAIEVYSKKYNIDKLCKFYLTDEEKGHTNIVDVTNQTEKIYLKLARPLQELENLEYGNTGI